MRRSASEIISELEMRVARLEKQSGRINTVTVRHNNSDYEIVEDSAYRNNGVVGASGNRNFYGRRVDESTVHFRNEEDSEEFVRDITKLGLKVSEWIRLNRAR